MKNKKNVLVEASWELFFKTGDPFYILAKNTFEKEDKTEDDENKNKSMEE